MFNRILKISLSLFILTITCLAMEVEKQPDGVKLLAPVPRKPGQKTTSKRSKIPTPEQQNFEKTYTKPYKPFSNLSSIKEEIED